ncbi:hypothetical protein M409DRAFT_16707 [Zasmidium cellare ATCC 36951]|uniref:Uncharacterized protein n=1 Tax=Zasmidium cellare ATCC 36951 TaxID=1080233 RepID=A0A6A6D012_ZASCE|nr:uncharacterized protein M409DRAFT_16707 [Zasmidium cellare ATCC 36951]KAF2172744.1 hypothetical protein M409DRAFT_16707 [Zasmidium cellare ATCC 36951]
MAPGASFQSTDGGAFPMTGDANFPRQDGASGAASSAPAAVSPAIVGAGIGVGILILAIIIGVVVRIHIARRNHQRSMAELERGLASSPSRQMEMARPISATGCGSLMPHGQAGWDALYSNDSVNEPQHAARPDKRQRTSVSIPQRIRQSKRLRAFKHLSAIMENTESPRIETQTSTPPSPQAVAKADRLMGSPKLMIGQAQTADHAIEAMDITDAFNQRGSPKYDIWPSVAINSPARYGANDDESKNNRPAKTLRSVSAGVLDTDGAVFGNSDRLIRNPKRRERPSMHARSASLGAPTSRPPSGPVPPLPAITPEAFTNDEFVRLGLCVTRESSESSINSAGSSVLVTSPILKMHGTDMPAASPTVEEVVAGDDRAALKSVLNRQWQNPNITGPRPNASLSNMKHDRTHSSIKGSIRYDSESALSHRLSIGSTSSGGSRAENRLSVLSIPQIATADRVSISRVSSSNSLLDGGSAGRIQKIETPPRRKSHRQSLVSASGSPAARDKRRSSALRDMSSNITGPVKRPSPRRQMSVSTRASSCSSNGNPFQWDTSSSNILPKPSALKGSPTARKTKGRLNCVRISTLTPEVFGNRSRSSSPPDGIVMDDILEERESDEIKREVEKERAEVERAVASERRRSRPPMPARNVSSESCLRIQTLRASLTPSSPTLSSWNNYHDQSAQHAGGLASHPSDTYMSVSRNSSRQSNRSSGNFVIPRFPSPSKARASIAVTIPQRDSAPMPEFSLDVDIESPTLGFNDINSSSPFGLAVSSRTQHSPVSPEDSANGDSPVEFSPVSPVDMPSSPPLPLSKEKEYDPGWCPVVFDFPASHEYDPASPPFIWNGFSSDYPNPDRSSGIWLPFAVNIDDEVSPRSRLRNQVAHGLGREKDDSPPLSPKTIPTVIPDLSPKKSAEKLTSSNASSVMAKSIEPASTSSFLGVEVPVLAPPSRETDTTLPQWQLEQRPATAPQPTHRRQRSVSNLRTPRPSTARAPPLPTIPQSSSPASPVSVPAPLSIASRIRTSAGEQAQKAIPMGPRSAPAKSVLKNAMALRRMNSEVQTHRESRESRNFTRLGREPSPLLPWIGTETEDIFDYDTRAGAGAESSSQASFSDVEVGQQQPKHSRHSVLGVPQVDIDIAPCPSSNRNTATSALDDLCLDDLEKVIDGALAGFDAEHRASITPKPSAYAYGQGYNTTTNHTSTSPTNDKASKRNSNVWDDGEKFWSGAYRPESFELPEFQLGSVSTPRKSPLASALELEREDGTGMGTVDPRLLSTPSVSVAATPRSLYDADGFLK